jgi:(1->4)-alpha-D-glucan 1-alpha-D-glucosylmutase
LHGDVTPGETTGTRAEHVVAVARTFAGRRVVGVAPRLTATLAGAECRVPLGDEAWQDTAVVLPPGYGAGLRDVLTGAAIPTPAADGVLTVAAVLRDFPVALLYDAGDFR